MNLYRDFDAAVRAAVGRLADAGRLPAGLEVGQLTVEPPRDPAHGDLATNAAMVLAKPAGMKPRDIAVLLAGELAGVAGVALSQIDNVSPNLGQSYIIDSFMVVVFGGVGNLWGTLVGALTLGVANKFLEPYAGAVLGKILLLVFIILFIQRRPRGLFALRGRSVEA